MWVDYISSTGIVDSLATNELRLKVWCSRLKTAVITVDLTLSYPLFCLWELIARPTFCGLWTVTKFVTCLRCPSLCDYTVGWLSEPASLSLFLVTFLRTLPVKRRLILMLKVSAWILLASRTPDWCCNVVVACYQSLSECFKGWFIYYITIISCQHETLLTC